MGSFFQTIAPFVISLSALLFISPIIFIISLMDKVEIGPIKINLTRKPKTARYLFAFIGLVLWIALYIPLVSRAFKAVEENPNLRPSTGKAIIPEAAAIAVGDNVFNVSAQKGWQDTGLFIEAGTQVNINVSSGKWTYWHNHEPYNGGEGDQGYICSDGDPSYKLRGTFAVCAYRCLNRKNWG